MEGEGRTLEVKEGRSSGGSFAVSEIGDRSTGMSRYYTCFLETLQLHPRTKVAVYLGVAAAFYAFLNFTPIGESFVELVKDKMAPLLGKIEVRAVGARLCARQEGRVPLPACVLVKDRVGAAARRD